MTFLLYQIHHLRKVHADPHPGNFLISKKGTLIAIDFGCMKEVPEDFYIPYFELANKESINNKVIFKEKMYDMIPKLKKKYKSHTLTCLHNNSLDKQKFPTINMIRQILKCNKLKLTPQFLCKGYNKINNQKIIERYYIIKKIL